MSSVHQIRGDGPDQSPSPICNVEAEAALLGALMIDNRLIGEIAELLQTDEAFYEPLHGRVYAAILNLVAAGGTANPVTLKPVFESDPAMRELGGPSYLAQLTGSGAAVIGARNFAEQINELARIRKLFGMVDELKAKTLRDGIEIGDAYTIAAAVEGLAYSAGERPGQQARTFSLADSMDRVLTRIADIRSSGRPIGATAPDIPELTDVVGPLERGHLHIWAGRPGMGKSGLACGAARSFAANGHGVGFISLEMSDVDLGTRFSADVALSFGEPIRHDTIRDARISDHELKTLVVAANEVRQMPIRLADLSGVTLSRLAMKARQMKREIEARGFSFDVLVVDYLQLVHSDRRYENKVAEVTDVSAGLKRLAKELDCAVVALSQLSRAVEQREDKRPQLSDLRESGAIEQDADTVCFLFREEYYLKDREPNRHEKAAAWEAWDVAMCSCRDELELIVPKRRNGKEGKARCRFLRDYQAVRSHDFVVPTALYR